MLNEPEYTLCSKVNGDVQMCCESKVYSRTLDTRVWARADSGVYTQVS